MSINPNTGRRFTFESVNEYYTAKMENFKSVLTPVLTDPGPISIDALIAHFKKIADGIDLVLPDGKTWEQIIEGVPDCKKESLWKFRDYVFATSMIWVGHTILPSVYTSIKIKDNPVRIKPVEVNIINNEFTVIGSQKLTSDIDVTIQGPGSYFIIMVLEDLFSTFTNKGVRIRRMDLEFYTDFRIAKMAYVNVSKFTDAEKCDMLKYAYISYFRSTHSLEISALARSLGEHFLAVIGSTTQLDTILSQAVSEWTTTAPDGELDREKFYEIAQEIDEETTHVHRLFIAKRWQNAARKVLNTAKKERGNARPNSRASFANTVTEVASNASQHELARKIFFDIARGNIHRPESYLLPSTAVHVVDIEQLGAAGETNTSVSKYFGTTPVTGVIDFAYIASAIEQLGYLEHYHPIGTICSIKGIKYVGRMIRALINAKLLSGDEIFLEKTYAATYDMLNSLRKSGVPSCDINISDLNTDIVNKLAPVEENDQWNGFHEGGGRKKVTRRRHRRGRRTYGNRR